MWIKRGKKGVGLDEREGESVTCLLLGGGAHQIDEIKQLPIEPSSITSILRVRTIMPIHPSIQRKQQCDLT